MAFPTPPAYAGSKSQTSQGTIIWVNFQPSSPPGSGSSPSPPAWVPIGECLGAEFSDKAMFDKSTNLQSQAEEFLPVLPDPGKLTVDLNRVSSDAGQQALQTSKANGLKLQYAVVFPINLAEGQSEAGDQRQFWAYVEELHPVIKTNTRITNKFTLQISGPITDIAGS